MCDDTPLAIIRRAHQHSGATVTELAESTGIGRARLGEWLSRAKPGAKDRGTVYSAPTPVDARRVVEAAVTFARGHLQAVSELRDALPKPG